MSQRGFILLGLCNTFGDSVRVCIQSTWDSYKSSVKRGLLHMLLELVSTPGFIVLALHRGWVLYPASGRLLCYRPRTRVVAYHTEVSIATRSVSRS